MTMRTRFGSPFAAAIVALALGLGGCAEKKTSTAVAPSKLTVKGVVLDESNKPIADASVSIGTMTVRTSATGEYIAEPNLKLGDVAVFNVAASGFGARSEPVAMDLIGINQNFQLRKHSLTQSIALPTTTGGNVQITFAGADVTNGSITLVVAANQLVNLAGAAVQGNVDVALTYWGPNDPLTNTPAPMIGYSGRTASSSADDLLSYGMGDIDIRQGNQPVHLAAGQNLQLSFTVPQVFADNLNELTPTDAAYPQLWSVDSNSGVWVAEGSAADGRIAYDAPSKTIRAQLPHLSAWNIDGVGTTNGCVKGTLIDCNKKPVANTQAWLWLIGKGEIGHSPIASASDGSFCTNIAGAGALTSKSSAVGTASWFVSLPAAPAASQCNPTDTASFQELCLGKPASTKVCRSTSSGHRFADGLARCNTPSTDFAMCGYCAGTTKPAGRCTVRTGDGQPFSGPAFVSGQCTDLGQVVVPTADCKGNTSTADVCAGKGDMTGKPCTQDVDCCPNAALECADGACVPRTTGVN